MSESPFSTFTLGQYRNMAALCLVGAAFFLATAGSGFRGGVNIGLGSTLLVLAVIVLATRRFVQKRLSEPLEYWQDLQRRLGPRFWGATFAVTTIGLTAVVLALMAGAMWAAGFMAGVTALPALLVVGRLTGQVKPI